MVKELHMEIQHILKTATIRPSSDEGSVAILEYRYRAGKDLAADSKSSSASERVARFLDLLSYEELLDHAGSDAATSRAFSDRKALFLQAGGWQSWSAGWELGAKEKLPRKVLVVPELIIFTNRYGDDPAPEEVVGHFIAYIRAGDRYLCLASLGAEEGATPPVSYRFDRTTGTVGVEAFDAGKKWKEGDLIARVAVFVREGYFAFKDELGALYHQGEPFAGLSFLAAADEGSERFVSGGWESWYNHYTDINEDLILADLQALGQTENLVKRYFIQRKKPTVFQVDDGWEQKVGDWESDDARFPQGMKSVFDQIVENGYIPGLWFAPFLVTRSSLAFTEKSDWLLRDASGDLVAAGFNDKWDKVFYCLDLSRREVIDYLAGLMKRAIDEWGVRYLKLDFLYAGLLHGAFANGGAAYEHYRVAIDALTAIKEDREGRPVAYLGCGVPFEPSYRHFPLSRIGADTKEDWDWPKVRLIGHVGRPSAYVSVQDTIGRSYMNGTLFASDPDVVFMRTERMRLTEKEKELIALTNFLLAGQIMFSDDPAEFRAGSEEDRLTGSILALYDRLEGDDYGALRIAKDVYRLESRSGRVTGLINLSPRAFRLDKEAHPDVFSRVEGGQPLIEHAKGTAGRGSRIFDGHSISLYTAP